ncbi:MAG: fluoride efflux transporter CrcB [Caulobacteraceae bacterium]
MITYLWVAIGGALGSIARYGCSSLLANWVGQTFPWGTLFVNVLGSFIIGFFATLTGPDGRMLVSGEMRQFVMVGICGGYTTFSSFSLQTLTLVQDGEVVRAGLNVGGSVVLCLASVWLGYASAAALNAVKGS